MDVQNSIKQNPYFAAVIAAFVVYIAYTQLSGPKTYKDCVLQIVQEAKTNHAVHWGRKTCREKFPLPPFVNPYLSQ